LIPSANLQSGTMTNQTKIFDDEKKQYVCSGEKLSVGNVCFDDYFLQPYIDPKLGYNNNTNGTYFRADTRNLTAPGWFGFIRTDCKTLLPMPQQYQSFPNYEWNNIGMNKNERAAFMARHGMLSRCIGAEESPEHKCEMTKDLVENGKCPKGCVPCDCDPGVCVKKEAPLGPNVETGKEGIGCLNYWGNNTEGGDWTRANETKH
jgi:hypothetical protein